MARAIVGPYLSQRVYYALAWQGTLTEEENWKVLRLQLAEHFHWTLEYIDSLSLGEIVDILQILDGREKAAHSVNKK